MQILFFKQSSHPSAEHCAGCSLSAHLALTCLYLFCHQRAPCVPAGGLANLRRMFAYRVYCAGLRKQQRNRGRNKRKKKKKAKLGPKQERILRIAILFSSGHPQYSQYGHGLDFKI